jgi:site-specific DNA-cytosine methylase
MRVLIACEESQEVCKAFRERGHEAYSCDIQECSGGHPEWHLQCDVREVLDEDWDLIIAHPPCTRLCSSGQRWLYYGSEEYRNKKKQEQKEAIEFFMLFVNAKCEKIAIENPVGIMSTLYRKPDCIYNPYDFIGETECKKTCLWLKGLEPLKPTQVIAKEERTMNIWKANFNGKQYAWNDKEVAKLRSKTPTGVARAMAEQWG